MRNANHLIRDQEKIKGEDKFKRYKTRNVVIPIIAAIPSIPCAMSITKALAVFALLGSSLALPDKVRHHHARASSCTPAAGGSTSIDDVPAITSAIASCGKGGTIVIPAGVTYYLKSPLDFAGCVGCDFQLEGTLKFSTSTDIWKGQTAMINIKNIDGLRLRSVTGSGVIDGNGQNAYVFLVFPFPTLITVH